MRVDKSFVIQERRKEFGWTQEELAEKVHLSVRTIGRAETNRRVGKETLKAICKALEISFETSEAQSIKTPKVAIPASKISSAHDLAHVLINVGHLEVEDLTYGYLYDDFEEQLVETFLEKCEIMTDIWDEGNQDQRKASLNILQSELNKLHNRKIFVSGSCTDSLVNDFKVANLSFYKC